MNINDDRIKQVLSLLDQISKGDTAVAMELMIASMLKWCTRYAGCLALVDVTIKALETAKTSMLEDLGIQGGLQ